MRIHTERADSMERPAKRKRRIGLASVCGAALMTTAMSAAMAVPASASVTPRGCQATTAVLYNGSSVVWSGSCSSTNDNNNVANKWATKFVAGGWSGGVYGTDGQLTRFCDGETKAINYYVRQVYLNNTKPDRCK
jgi:hypothetical protein